VLLLPLLLLHLLVLVLVLVLLLGCEHLRLLCIRLHSGSSEAGGPAEAGIHWQPLLAQQPLKPCMRLLLDGLPAGGLCHLLLQLCSRSTTM